MGSFRDELERVKFKRNPYADGTRTRAKKINQNSPQFPKRMFNPLAKTGRPKPKRIDEAQLARERAIDEILLGGKIPTEEEIDALLKGSAIPGSDKSIPKKKPSIEDRDHLIGCDLVNRHRYGDDIDILRATFTKSKKEIEDEKFLLILASRRLLKRIFWSLTKVPKHEKYVLGSHIRECAFSILKDSVAIKKRFYRKNMLESIDIQLEILRELYRTAYEGYPEWVDDAHLNLVYEDINEVGRLVGGLLKTTVV